MVGMTTRDAAVSWCLFWSRTACGFCHYTTILQLYSSPKVVLGVQYSYRYNLPGRCALASVLAGGGVGVCAVELFCSSFARSRSEFSLCFAPFASRDTRRRSGPSSRSRMPPEYVVLLHDTYIIPMHAPRPGDV